MTDITTGPASAGLERPDQSRSQSTESRGTSPPRSGGTTEVVSHAGDEIKGVGSLTAEQARSVASRSRDHLVSEADGLMKRAADALTGASKDLSSLADGNGGTDSPAADAIRRVGDQADEFAARLRNRGYEGMRDDLTNWARANPGVFLVGTAATGFVVTRLLRGADTSAIADAAKADGSPGSAQELGTGTQSTPSSGQAPEPMVDLRDSGPDGGGTTGVFASQPEIDR